jgi:hypothetical protein
MDDQIDIPIYKSLPEKVLSNVEVSYLSPIDIQQLYVNEPFIGYNKNSNIIYLILITVLLSILLFFI